MGSGRFRDREEAGRVLGERLRSLAGAEDVIVLALPRGGVPVAHGVARALDAPLDVFVVRKLGVPGHEELAMGAIASGGVRFVGEQVVRELGLSEEDLARAAAAESAELARQERLYRGGAEPADVAGRTVVLVDDGLATGATMRAAVVAVRRRGAARVVVAVPVASRPALADLREAADEVVCERAPETFMAVGAWYEDFSQVSDEEVQALLGR